MKRLSVVGVLVVFFCGCSSDEVLVPDNAELYVHAGSGIPFPSVHESFVRLGVDEGASDNAGVQVEYHFRQAGSDVSMMVSVYPNPDAKPAGDDDDDQDGPPQSEAQDKRLEVIQQEILDAGTDEEHRFIAAYDIAIERGGKPVYGKRAYFRDRMEAFSNAYIFEHGEWFVEYRAVFARDLEWVAERFVLNHAWAKATPAE